MPTYGQDITYTNINGFVTTCGVNGEATPEDAKREAIELAKLDGWTPPQWWQWWRRNDTRL